MIHAIADFIDKVKIYYRQNYVIDGLIQKLLRPQNQPALTLRNYGLALSIGLVPVVALVVKSTLPDVLASFLFNFGVVAAIATITLIYLSHTPEPTSISAKLIGVSLDGRLRGAPVERLAIPAHPGWSDHFVGAFNHRHWHTV